MNKNINIALVGLGQVGIFLYNELNSKKKEIEIKTGKRINIVAVSAKNKNKKRRFNVDKKIFYSNPLKIFKEKKIDILFECIGLSDGISKKIVEYALKNKVNVITPNKALIAKHGDHLAKLAETNKVNLEFEASVAGGIPIIRSLSSKARIENISWFAGILNGTSNYILSKMESDGIELEEGVKQAQELGFAEADPTLDLNGTDAAQKAKVLSYLAFGSKLDSSIELDIEGIDIVESIDFKFALELGYSIKPLSIGSYEKNRLILKSFPALIQQSSILSKVNEEMNAIEVFTKDSGSNLFYGPGAGPKPTASSILSDLFDIAQNNKVNYSKFGQGLMEISNNTFSCQRYFRLEVNDSPGVMAKISSFIAKQNLSIESVIQKEDFSQNGLIPIVIVLNECNENELEDLLNSFSKEKDLFKKIVHLRIFNPNK